VLEQSWQAGPPHLVLNKNNAACPRPELTAFPGQETAMADAPDRMVFEGNGLSYFTFHNNPLNLNMLSFKNKRR
jgi:hypothetical protein